MGERGGNRWNEGWQGSGRRVDAGIRNWGPREAGFGKRGGRATPGTGLTAGRPKRPRRGRERGALRGIGDKEDRREKGGEVGRRGAPGRGRPRRARWAPPGLREARGEPRGAARGRGRGGAGSARPGAVRAEERTGGAGGAPAARGGRGGAAAARGGDRRRRQEGEKEGRGRAPCLHGSSPQSARGGGGGAGPAAAAVPASPRAPELAAPPGPPRRAPRPGRPARAQRCLGAPAGRVPRAASRSPAARVAAPLCAAAAALGLFGLRSRRPSGPELCAQPPGQPRPGAPDGGSSGFEEAGTGPGEP